MFSGIGVINLILECVFFWILSFFLQMDLDMRIKLIIMYVIMNYLLGRYREKSLLMYDEIQLILLSDIGFFLVGFLLFPNVVINIQDTLQILLLSCAMFVFSVIASRYTHIIFWKFFKHNTMIIGAGKTALEIEYVCKSNRFSLIDIKCFINCNHSNYLRDVNQTIKIDRYNVYPLSMMESVIDKYHIDSVIIAIPEMTNHDLSILIDRISKKVNRIKYLPQIQGLVTFDTRVQDFDGVLLVASSNGDMHQLSRILKRLIDIVGSLFGMLLLIPLTIYVWIKNRSEGDKGPLFFTQTRIGKDGKEFKIYKYRTMVPNAEKVLEELMEKDSKIREEYLTNKKLENDPRITAAGKFLRAKSLDEFPQFINVFLGQMSLIGPRPYLPREKEDMGKFYDCVVACRPGLTGMWQSHGRSEVGFQERLEFDEYYYRNWSFWLDVTIFFKTIRQVIYGKGAM